MEWKTLFLLIGQAGIEVGFKDKGPQSKWLAWTYEMFPLTYGQAPVTEGNGIQLAIAQSVIKTFVFA